MNDPFEPSQDRWGPRPDLMAPPDRWDPDLFSHPPTAPAGPAEPDGGSRPPAPDPGPSERGRRGLAALALVAVFVAGAGGVLVGRELALEADGPLTGVSGSMAEPVPTEPRTVPISDDDAIEPVAAVAAALAPAVVQIETGSGLGSGFIYDSDGLIMTAAHVVDGATEVTVRLADGTRVEGTVLGTDMSTDVAVVRIDSPRDLPVAELALDDIPSVGQTAVAIGSPFGLDQTVTAGIVSAVGRSSETPGGYIPAIQTDAPINSGNSGGALADRSGRVIGINDSIITGGRSSGNVGVGFAIPIDLAKAVADKIVAGDSLDAGYLGVVGGDATGERAGALITAVEPGSPAASAGLQIDDLVVAFEGRATSSMIDLAARIRTAEPHATVQLTVLRGERELTVEVTLAAAPDR